MKNVEYVYTFGMDQDTLEKRLEETGVGVLSLAKDSVAYAIPIAYYYDGESVFLRLAFEGDSTKRDYLEATSEACLCVYETRPDEENWSILIRGPLHQLTGGERDRFDTTTVNERFNRLHVFGQDIEAIDIHVYELQADLMTGRTTES